MTKVMEHHNETKKTKEKNNFTKPQNVKKGKCYCFNCLLTFSLNRRYYIYQQI